MVNVNNLRRRKANAASAGAGVGTGNPNGAAPTAIGEQPSGGGGESIQSLMEEILSRGSRTISAETVRREIATFFRKSAAVGVEMDFFNLSLIDPVSRTRIRIPVRSTQCDHFQCFDLFNFLSINFSSSSNGNGGSGEGQTTEKIKIWRCPHCQVSARKDQIRIDGYLQEILSKVGPLPFEVELLPDGSWREVEQVDFKDVQLLVTGNGSGNGDGKAKGRAVVDEDVVELVPKKRAKLVAAATATKRELLEEAAIDEGTDGFLHQGGRAAPESSGRVFRGTPLAPPQPVQNTNCGGGNCVESSTSTTPNSSCCCERLRRLFGLAPDEDLFEAVQKLKFSSTISEGRNTVEKHQQIGTGEEQILIEPTPATNREAGVAVAAVCGATIEEGEVEGEDEEGKDREREEENLDLELQDEYNATDDDVEDDEETPSNNNKKDEDLERLEILAESAPFQRIRPLLDQCPELLDDIVGEMAKTSPELAELIRCNHEQFLSLLKSLEKKQKIDNEAGEKGTSSQHQKPQSNAKKALLPTPIPIVDEEDGTMVKPEHPNQKFWKKKVSPFQKRLIQFEKSQRVEAPNVKEVPSSELVFLDDFSTLSTERYWVVLTWKRLGNRRLSDPPNFSPFRRPGQVYAGRDLQRLFWECFSVVCNMDMQMCPEFVRVSFKTELDAQKVVSCFNGLIYFGCRIQVTPNKMTIAKPKPLANKADSGEKIVDHSNKIAHGKKVIAIAPSHPPIRQPLLTPPPPLHSPSHRGGEKRSAGESGGLKTPPQFLSEPNSIAVASREIAPFSTAKTEKNMEKCTTFFPMPPVPQTPPPPPPPPQIPLWLCSPFVVPAPLFVPPPPPQPFCLTPKTINICPPSSTIDEGGRNGGRRIVEERGAEKRHQKWKQLEKLGLSPNQRREVLKSPSSSIHRPKYPKKSPKKSNANTSGQSNLFSKSFKRGVEKVLSKPAPLFSSLLNNRRNDDNYRRPRKRTRPRRRPSMKRMLELKDHD